MGSLTFRKVNEYFLEVYWYPKFKKGYFFLPFLIDSSRLKCKDNNLSCKYKTYGNS